MQSFLLLITICYVLIINVTFCRSCLNPVCKARCYFRQKGFDFGYCEEGICKCSPPTIYVFDGIGRDLSDNLIHHSLNNNNIIQNSISKSNHEYGSSTAYMNTNNKIWEDTVRQIIDKYPMIKEDDLKYLKAKIIDNWSALNCLYLSIFFPNSLDKALKELKMKEPTTSKECEDIIKLLSKLQSLNGSIGDDTDSKTAMLKDKTSDLNTKIQEPNVAFPLLKQTSEVAKKISPATPRSLTPKTDDSNKPASENNEKNMPKKNDGLNCKMDQDQKDKLFKRTVIEEEEKKHEVFVELSEETAEDEHSSEEHLLKRKPSHTQEKNKTVEKHPPVGDNNVSHEWVSESYSASAEDDVIAREK